MSLTQTRSPSPSRSSMSSSFRHLMSSRRSWVMMLRGMPSGGMTFVATCRSSVMHFQALLPWPRRKLQRKNVGCTTRRVTCRTYFLFIRCAYSMSCWDSESLPEMIASGEPITCGFPLSDPDDPRFQKFIAYRRRFSNLLLSASKVLRNQGEENTVDAILMLASRSISHLALS